MVLDKTIVFIDFETTGADTLKDRIVQYALLRLLPNGETETASGYVNPGMPIPKKATDIHGITDLMVSGSPRFSEIAGELFNLLDGCDIAGYNSDSFDIPILAEEFERCGIDFPGSDTVTIDALLLEREINSHKLGATYKRYFGENLSGHHDALTDARATLDILLRQVEDRPRITVSEIRQIYRPTPSLDYAGKVISIDGVPCWNFGQHKGEPVTSNMQYLDWVLRSEFPAPTKKILRTIKSYYEKQ